MSFEQRNEFTEIVRTGALEYGIELQAEAIAAFELYYKTLEQKRKSINLTTITGARDVAELHFLDSLALFRAADFKNVKVIDIGSGAGFPGLPLKIAEPTIELTLLDATAKRIEFLSELCDALDVIATFLHSRAEDAAHKQELREGFDIVVSRAVAELSMLSELCLPFLRVDGLFLAMKGVDSADELESAMPAILTLGAQVVNSIDYLIPGTDITHRVIIIKKVSHSPEQYPRRFARIKKAPLA